MKSLESSRVARLQPAASTQAPGAPKAAMASTERTGTETAAVPGRSGTSRATQGVPAEPQAAGTIAAGPLASEAGMPLWILLLGLVALVIPAMASVRLVVRFLARLVTRWPPLKPVGFLLLAALAFVGSYVVVRRELQASPAADTAPQSVPVASRSSASTAPTTPAPQATPESAAPFPAGRAGRAAFVRTMVRVLERKGLTRRQALLFAAHLARETGWGRWVRGNNFGNIKVGSGWHGPTFSLRDGHGFSGQYRAWPTLEQGVESTLSLVRDSARYRKAWRLLRANDVRWYGQLGLDGYYEGPTGHARDGSRFHTVHDLATVTDAQREYEGIVALATQYDGGDA